MSLLLAVHCFTGHGPTYDRHDLAYCSRMPAASWYDAGGGDYGSQVICGAA
jgi:hypothetical protein